MNEIQILYINKELKRIKRNILNFPNFNLNTNFLYQYKKI